MNLSVVIPVFNEEGNIINLLSRLDAVIRQMNLSGVEYLFINDGSTDRSLEIIKEQSKQNNRIKWITFSRNFGHQVAVTAGLDFARGDAVVIIDADLQDPPELIPELYNKLRSGYEVVYARRKSRQGENPMKKFTASLFYRLMKKITSINIPVDAGDFRIVDKKIVDVLRKMSEQEKFLRGQISWIGFNQTYIDYDRDERGAGKSGYSLRKMIRFALDGITSFSNFPLKFASIVGFVVSGFSFLMMIYALYSRFISQDYVPGWASLMLAVLFLGGIQLIGIGIIGEYISRMSANVRGRPLYVIRDKNTDTEPESN